MSPRQRKPESDQPVIPGLVAHRQRRRYCILAPTLTGTLHAPGAAAGPASWADHEEWRPVAGYEGLYDVSSFGRVRSHPRIVICKRQDGGVTRYPIKGRIVVISSHPDSGWRSVVLSRSGEAKSRGVADLVAEAFLGPRPERMRVLHKDDDHANNRAANLRYATVSEMNRHAIYDRGKGPLGERAYNARLTVDQVREICRLIRGGRRFGAIAALYGVGYGAIESIAYAKTWRHLPEVIDAAAWYASHRKRRSAAPRPPDAKIEEVCALLHDEWLTQVEVAQRCGVTKSVVGDIALGRGPFKDLACVREVAALLRSRKELSAG